MSNSKKIIVLSFSFLVLAAIFLWLGSVSNYWHTRERYQLAAIACIVGVIVMAVAWIIVKIRGRKRKLVTPKITVNPLNTFWNMSNDKKIEIILFGFLIFAAIFGWIGSVSSYYRTRNRYVLASIACIIGVIVMAIALVIVKIRGRKRKPVTLKISANPSEILADGKSTSNIRIDLLDKKGEMTTALDDIEIILTTDVGNVKSPITVARGKTHQETIFKSSHKIGEFIISANSIGLKGASTNLTARAYGILIIMANPLELPADGMSASSITIELLTFDGKPMQASEDVEITLTTTRGSLATPVIIKKGETDVNATLYSSTEPGNVVLSAKSEGLADASLALIFTEKKRFCMHCGESMSVNAIECPRCHRQPMSHPDTKICPGCSNVIPKNAVFCSDCGARQLTQ